MQQRRGTATEWTTADPVLAAGEIGYETDTGRFKFGDGATAWSSIEYFSSANDIIDGAPAALDTLNELAAALNDDENFASTVTTALNARLKVQTQTAADWATDTSAIAAETIAIESDTNKYKIAGLVGQTFADLEYVATEDYVTNAIDARIPSTVDTGEIGYLDGVNANIQTQLDTLGTNITTNSTDIQTNAVNISTNTGDISSLQSDMATAQADIATNSADISTLQGDVTTNTAAAATNSADISTLQTDVATNTADITTLNGAVATNTADITTLDTEKADLAGPTFTGTVVLPSTTSIGNVDATEIGYLDGVTAGIQSQIDGKLGTTTASTTYAPLSGPTFTGTVSLPSTTSIGNVDATELGYLDGVTSGVQSQLDAKAPIADPTFTGTVSGIDKTMVGLSNVDNTADADKPVSTATQAALDLKANLAGASFTGNVTIGGDLTVSGTTVTVSASDLSVRDNMIYLNQAGQFDLSNAVGDGTNVVYTTSTDHDIKVGDYITVTSANPSSFDISGEGLEVTAVTADTITVASTVTDTYVDSGTLRGKSHANPDLGWAAGRYDVVNGSGYGHAGIFRDATDGTFKFFDGYVPEPDESVFIDTSDASFALAPLAVSDLNADSVIFADGTVQTKAGVPSLTEFTEKTASYTLDTLDHQDNIVEMNSGSATTFTIPTNATLAWPVGASMDIFQTGAGQVTIEGAAGVTVNYTPGNKLRTQWSSATILKRATDSWVIYGDLTA